MAVRAAARDSGPSVWTGSTFVATAGANSNESTRQGYLIARKSSGTSTVRSFCQTSYCP